MSRQYPRSIYLGMKSQFRRLVVEAGGLEAAAALTRVNRSRLADYYDPHSEFHAPADVVADLEAATGRAWVTEYLAALHGDGLAPKDGCLRSATLDFVAWMGGLADMANRVTAEHSDGGREITDTEYRQMSMALDFGDEKLAELRRVLHGNVVDHPSKVAG